ncbi:MULTISPECIES: PGPGW domain-containing protein [unclassified Cryobacterium]|uniref:PGPGW domain-containing protein n=1 Tax=unclassified Cryobacterium TaxID=2649013 RepID=UPI002AB4A4C8|nr:MULTISPECIES: PGPGW domain-containing protein [unclassified Cryobacterium]MDY7543414.1 PGPGW domain-containing protein [Cryobacterium sp. 5B3]MEB0000640.1 PGPGW domain-containing protein [Cryobacterium sp. RTS3]MEB0264941.1 PGPGW domain-containing protein [Cryobacterium sp. 10I5]MEB0274736.1 PGPGW domain-containing protein [Cryobacterium sp. 5B3]
MPVRTVARSARDLIGRNRTVDRVYRTSVGVIGGGTVVLGIVLIPLPGPGALISLGGLALLGTEFEGAKKVSHTANDLARRGAAKVSQLRQDRRDARQH